MRRVVAGWVLLLLGAFFLTVGFLTAFWVPGQVQRVPLSLDSTTYLKGQADKYDLASGKLVNSPVKVTDVTQIDPKRSDGKVAVWVDTTCANIDTGNPPDCVGQKDARLITDSLTTFATDRHTGMAVNDASYVSTEVKYSGLMNKFPFNTEKKSYPFYDSTLGGTAPARYVGTETLDGLEVYRFDTDIKDAPIELGNGIGGVYNLTKTMWVDPTTGAIVDQRQRDLRTFADNGDTALDMTIAFTPDTVAKDVQGAKDNIAKLRLFTRTVPIIGFALGIPFVFAGVVLIATAPRPRAADGTREAVREPVS